MRNIAKKLLQQAVEQVGGIVLSKRAFDALGVKKLPTVKVLQAEYTDLLAKKKAAYEDFKRLRQENQELQAVKSNVDSLLQIKQEEKKEQKQEKKQEQDR